MVIPCHFSVSSRIVLESVAETLSLDKKSSNEKLVQAIFTACIIQSQLGKVLQHQEDINQLRITDKQYTLLQYALKEASQSSVLTRKVEKTPLQDSFSAATPRYMSSRETVESKSSTMAGVIAALRKNKLGSVGKDRKGNSFSHHVVKRGRVDLLDATLPDLENKNDLKQTPLHIAIKRMMP